MRHIHHQKPIIAHCLQRRNPLAHAVHQNFSAASGNRAQSGGFEIGYDFFQRLAEDLAEMNELAWTEPMTVHLRELRFDMRKQVDVPLFRELGMVPALHHNLSSTER